MLVCEKPEFVVILPPKTGTRSLHFLLRDQFPVKSFEPHHFVAPEQKLFCNALTICTARNPFSRLVSRWHHVRDPARIPPNVDVARIRLTEEANESDFVTFTRKYPMVPIAEITRGIRIDHWVHLERFVEDIRSLPIPGLRTGRVPHEHPGPGVPWENYYQGQPELVSHVLARYGEDFDLLGYATQFPGTLLK